MKEAPRSLGLFGLPALAEMAGCHAIFARLRLGRSVWWLLTFHPTAAGRTYAAYIAASLLWLRRVDGGKAWTTGTVSGPTPA